MNHAKPSLVRFSLRTLLVLMMLLCIALATTVSASPRVEYAMKWVSVLAPAAASLLAAATTGVKRAFWIGFAAFGIWAYMHMFTKNEMGGSLLTRFYATFHEYVGASIAELHRPEADAEAHRQLATRGRRTPNEPLDQIKARAPWFWTQCLEAGNVYVADISRKIAWYNLHLAVALFGGIATGFLAAQQESRSPKMPPG